MHLNECVIIKIDGDYYFYSEKINSMKEDRNDLKVFNNLIAETTEFSGIYKARISSKTDIEGNYLSPEQLNGKLIEYDSGLIGYSFYLTNERYGKVNYELNLIRTKKPKQKQIATNEYAEFKLVKRNQNHFITLNIAGLDYEFLLDSGASDVLISAELEKHLLDVGALRSTDYGKIKTYKLADGVTKSFRTATLNSLKIEGGNF